MPSGCSSCGGGGSVMVGQVLPKIERSPPSQRPYIIGDGALLYIAYVMLIW